MIPHALFLFRNFRTLLPYGFSVSPQTSNAKLVKARLCPRFSKSSSPFLFFKRELHPVNIAFSKQVLQKIDQEASRQKRSRSEWVELHFEELFFKPEQPVAIATKTG
jgi:hypothetical protein